MPIVRKHKTGWTRSASQETTPTAAAELADSSPANAGTARGPRLELFDLIRVKRL